MWGHIVLLGLLERNPPVISRSNAYFDVNAGLIVRVPNNTLTTKFTYDSGTNTFIRVLINNIVISL